MCSLTVLECAACVFFLKTVSLGKNPLKLCKTVRNEEATVRPLERQWDHVTHGETLRVERSVFILSTVWETEETLLQLNNEASSKNKKKSKQKQKTKTNKTNRNK